MGIVFFNFEWMFLNVMLAITGVSFGWLMIETKKPVFKLLFGILWLVFIPNTIYLLTDIIHLPEQMPYVNGVFRLLIILQYAFVFLAGLVTFIYGVYPLEKLFMAKFKKKNSNGLMAVLFINFFIAFGVTMGRFQRTNSWEIFSNTQKFITDAKGVTHSLELLLFVFLFGVIGNCIYFLLKERVIFLKTQEKKKRRR